MFFIASKILAFIISPINWIAIFLISALIVKDPRRKKNLLITAVVAFIFFSNSFIFNEFMHAWEVPAVQVNELDTCDVGIVLGGMVSYDEEFDRTQFYRGADRLLQTVELYRKEKIKKIFFVSGSGSITYQNHKEAPMAKRFLLHMKIPEPDILIESESRNTHENALFAKKIMDKKNMNGKTLLITSGFHLKRAIGCFNKVGVDVIPYSTDRYSGSRKFDLDFLFIPSAGILLNWDILMHEVVGYITYYFLGYL